MDATGTLPCGNRLPAYTEPCSNGTPNPSPRLAPNHLEGHRREGQL
ncbi:MAG: hypothetical protein MJZ62_00840 [Bacteroidales bacterium]|nr:hypothetical protein [Bacteroidales bacterium]